MDSEKLLTPSCCFDHVAIRSLAGASWMAEFGDPDTDGKLKKRCQECIDYRFPDRCISVSHLASLSSQIGSFYKSTVPTITLTQRQTIRPC
jgi:hypothetical protein